MYYFLFNFGWQKRKIKCFSLNQVLIYKNCEIGKGSTLFVVKKDFLKPGKVFLSFIFHDQLNTPPTMFEKYEIFSRNIS